ncbi:MAG: major capsid protein [Petrotogales bacterium]
MKGSGGIPALRLEVLNKVISKLPTPKNLFFTNLFPSQQYDSDSIRWILEYGTAGMSPFVAPGAPAPVTGDEGLYSEGSARAAYWKEKMFFDEQVLNNLREPLSQATLWKAERQLARGMNKLKSRSTKRREWMLAKMLFDGSLTYQIQGGIKFTVNYGIPSNHQQALTGDDVWDDGAGSPGDTATPVQDLFDIKATLSENIGKMPEYVVMNTQGIRVLLFNDDLQNLLKKSAFGEGDLFARPAEVLGNLLGIGTIMIYDELYEVGGWVSANVSDGDTDIYVDDATDFDATNNPTLRIYDMSQPFTYEDLTLNSVDLANNKLTVSSGPSNSYKANQDRVVMRKKYIPDDTLFMFTPTLEGEKIAEFMEAPFGLDRNWGMYTDKKDEWDPEGTWIRVQNKGLPVLYHPDAVYTLTFK